MRKTQVVIRFPDERMVEEIDTVAASLGFSSRVSYFVFLHHAHKSAMELTELESLTLRHLGDFGFSSFKQTASVKMLAKEIDRDGKLVRKALENLLLLDLVAKVPYVEGPFDADVQVDENTSYQVTKKGYAAVRALLLRDGREETKCGSDPRDGYG